MERIRKICSYLKECNTFADVACDHGYIAEYMLKNNLCQSAVVADISESCLQKAKNLLKGYIDAGRCRAVCCDGLGKIDENTDSIVIAGIGGEEIIKILKNAFIPKRFLLQPMKNADTLRAYLLENCCRLETDDIFFDKSKYYYIITGGRGQAQSYTKAQLAYGKDSLLNPSFYDFLRAEIQKIKSYPQNEMTAEHREDIIRQIKDMEEVLNNEPKRNI